jgi:N-acetyltransferase 10
MTAATHCVCAAAYAQSALCYTTACNLLFAVYERRFRTEAHGDVVGRFNERFMLSLADCGGCLICDDELNILPLSSRAKSIVALPPVDEGAASPEQAELTALKASLEGTPPIGKQHCYCIPNKQHTLSSTMSVVCVCDIVSIVCVWHYQ